MAANSEQIVLVRGAIVLSPASSPPIEQYAATLDVILLQLRGHPSTYAIVEKQFARLSPALSEAAFAGEPSVKASTPIRWTPVRDPSPMVPVVGGIRFFFFTTAGRATLLGAGLVIAVAVAWALRRLVRL